MLKDNSLIYNLFFSIRIIGQRGLYQFIKYELYLLLLTVRLLYSKKYYRFVGQAELSRLIKSDTVFIFGSGYSLNAIRKSEWSEIEKHDIIGFNFHFRQRFSRVDFHILREIKGGSNKQISDYAIHDLNEAMDHPLYKDTVLLLQNGWYAEDCNELLAKKLLKNTHRLFLYKNIRNSQVPSSDLAAGLTHGPGTITDCINFAYCLGWRKIVLVGVDLYDRRFFWLREDQDRDEDVLNNANRTMIHNTVANGIIDYLSHWRKELNAKGIELYVHNPKSLLSEVLPVYPQA
jgi:hypothetical protein